MIRLNIFKKKCILHTFLIQLDFNLPYFQKYFLHQTNMFEANKVYIFIRC